MDNDTLCSVLKEAAEISGKGYRFLDRHENAEFFRYGDILEKSLIYAAQFSSMGIKSGDKVAIVLPTCPEFFYAFFGTLFVGGVPVPLYPPIRLGRMDEYHQNTARMIKVSHSRLVCTNKLIKRIIGRSVAIAKPDFGIINVKKITGKPLDFHGSDPDKPALIQFSSGTTIAPKPVLLTHRQIIANVRAIIDRCLESYPEKEYGKYHCGVSWLPLYHDMGLIGSAMLAITQKEDLTLIPPEIFIAKPAIWLRTISKYRAIISPAPNFAYSLCNEKIKDDEIEGIDLSCWHVALNGAEPVTPSTLKKFIDRFEPYGLPAHSLTPVYGLSEAALAVTFSDLESQFVSKTFNYEKLLEGFAEQDAGGEAIVSLGKPLSGYQVKIRGDNEKELSEKKIGKVFVKGPSIMKEYYCNPKETEHTLDNGWLDTGDKGFIFNGELFLYGRDKDLIIIRGKNYTPQTIEMALDDFPCIRKGCVIAAGYIPSGVESEQLIVFIERDKNIDSKGDEDLANRASKKITVATGLVPESVIVLEPGTILRTSSGKLRRGETLTRYLDGKLVPPAHVSAIQMVAEMVKSNIAMTRMKLNIE